MVLTEYTWIRRHTIFMFHGSYAGFIDFMVQDAFHVFICFPKSTPIAFTPSPATAPPLWSSQRLLDHQPPAGHGWDVPRPPPGRDLPVGVSAVHSLARAPCHAVPDGLES